MAQETAAELNSNEASELFYVDLNPVYTNPIDSTPAYDRSSGNVFGLPPPTEEEKHAPAPRSCFNCGSTEHQMSACPERRNRTAINEARAAYQADRVSAGPRKGPPMRLIEAQAIEMRLLSFVDQFEPGKVSLELREAIGYGKESEDFPWLKEMTTFGYPPGYYVRQGDRSNAERMRRRIKGDAHSDWNATTMLLISDDANIAPAPEGNAPDLPPPPPTSAPETVWVRSVYYPTSYFDSNALPCCWPLQLPPLPGEEPETHAQLSRSARYQTERNTTRRPNAIPPWRMPRALDFHTPTISQSSSHHVQNPNNGSASATLQVGVMPTDKVANTEDMMDLESD